LESIRKAIENSLNQANAKNALNEAINKSIEDKLNAENQKQQLFGYYNVTSKLYEII